MNRISSMIVASFAGLAGALILPPTPGHATGGGPPGLLGRVEALETTVLELTQQLYRLRRANYRLTHKLACVSAESDSEAIVFEGCNVHVRNGEGETEAVNGVGNLIVGYDEADPYDLPTCSDGQYASQTDCEAAGETWAGNQKNGSHNVVIGPGHSYTRSGGLVAGERNVVNGVSATVSGGRRNVASGDFASVAGGRENIAGGERSSVGGGRENLASGFEASVGGGQENTASGPGATVTGGEDNEASGERASVSGGFGNVAEGTRSTVSGGSSLIATETNQHLP